MAKKQKNSFGKQTSAANLRKQSNPTTSKDKKQAIADDVKADIISYLRSVYMEQVIFADTINRVLGQGGENLGTFIQQLENNFKDIKSGREEQEEETAPQVKKINREAVIESVLKDELKSDDKNTKTKKPQGKLK